MKCSFVRAITIFAALILPIAAQQSAQASPITPGDLVVYRVGDGSASLANTGNAVFVDEYATSGTLVQSIAMPTTASGPQNQLVASGTATSEGLLSVSPNGQYVALTGYGSNIPAGSSLAGTAAATVKRVVGIIPVSTGLVDTTTGLTDFADANNPRSVVTSNGTDIWVGGAAGGVRYTTKGSSTSVQLSTTVTNIRQVNVYANQLFASDSSGSAVRLGTVGSGLPTTSGQTITNLPNFETSTGSPYAYFFADLSPTNGFGTTGLDTLYVADDGAGTPAGQIQKYTFSNASGNWTASGTASAGAIRGLTGFVNGVNVSLFGTTGGSSATGGGTLYGFSDSTGYGGSITGSASSLATAANNEAFRGIGYVAIPEPATVVLAGLSLLALATSSRRLRNRA
jgi:hypothetical protein